MQGKITQVFGTGDFTIWSAELGRLLMTHADLCTSRPETPAPGMDVVFTLDDGNVVSVAEAGSPASRPAKPARSAVTAAKHSLG